jgi:hypothetical protein
MLVAPGIWHPVDLDSAFLEKDVGIDWKRPFPAVWKTQVVEAATLYQGGVETAYRFSNGKTKTWRAGSGGHPIYPVWFQGDQAFFHLGKMFPPTGRVFVYALEGNKQTPVEFVKACFGVIPSLRLKAKLDFPDNITGVVPCEGHDLVGKRIFQLGIQAGDKQYLREVVNDWMARVDVMVPRLVHYGDFVETMTGKLKSWEAKATPELKPFQDKMKEQLDLFGKTFYKQMDGYKPREYLLYQREVAAKIKALVAEEGTECAPEGAYITEENHHIFVIFEDRLTAACGGDVREWARQAAFSCADKPSAVKYAEEIRNDIREFIGNDNHWETVY